MPSAHVQKRGDGWRVRWWERGVKHSRHAPTKRAAEQLKRIVEEQLALRGHTSFEGPPACPALSEAIDDWEQVQAARVSPRTLQSYLDAATMLLRYAAGWEAPDGPGPDPANVSVEVLRDDLLERLYGWLVASGRTRSTAYKRAGPVRLFWRWCASHSRYRLWVGTPPAELGLRRPAPPVAIAPTWAEADACIEECDGWLRRLAVLLRFTGLRLSSALLLDWRDVDLAARVLTVRPQIAKGERGYTVPVSAHLVAELAGWSPREGLVVQAPEAEVLAARGNGRGHAGRDLHRAWKRAGVRPEVRIGQPSHAFRKAFETGLVEAGASYHAVEALVGHRLPGTGRDYVDQAQGRGLWPLMVQAAAIVPPIRRGAIRLVAGDGAGPAVDPP